MLARGGGGAKWERRHPLAQHIHFVCLLGGSKAIMGLFVNVAVAPCHCAPTGFGVGLMPSGRRQLPCPITETVHRDRKNVHAEVLNWVADSHTTIPQFSVSAASA